MDFSIARRQKNSAPGGALFALSRRAKIFARLARKNASRLSRPRRRGAKGVKKIFVSKVKKRAPLRERVLEKRRRCE
jgi:hypothetical protein